MIVPATYSVDENLMPSPPRIRTKEACPFQRSGRHIAREVGAIEDPGFSGGGSIKAQAAQHCEGEIKKKPCSGHVTSLCEGSREYTVLELRAGLHAPRLGPLSHPSPTEIGRASCRERVQMSVQRDVVV